MHGTASGEPCKHLLNIKLENTDRPLGRNQGVYFRKAMVGTLEMWSDLIKAVEIKGSDTVGKFKSEEAKNFACTSKDSSPRGVSLVADKPGLL